MRYGIFSDIHSNLEALQAVVEAYRKESIDSYLCVGDVIGYGANPVECCQINRELAIATVAGNHDWAGVDLFGLTYFNPQAEAAIVWTKRYLDESSKLFLQTLPLTYKESDFTLVHGTLYQPEEFHYLIDLYAAQQTFTVMDTSLCFLGHSHVAGIFLKQPDTVIRYNQASNLEIQPQNKYIINVGSVGQPRDGNPKAAYCIYDSTEKKVQIKRVDYDIQAARKKIIAAGLPRILGDRLLVGS